MSVAILAVFLIMALGFLPIAIYEWKKHDCHGGKVFSIILSIFIGGSVCWSYISLKNFPGDTEIGYFYVETVQKKNGASISVITYDGWEKVNLTPILGEVLPEKTIVYVYDKNYLSCGLLWKEPPLNKSTERRYTIFTPDNETYEEIKRKFDMKDFTSKDGS
jgi:hypothetical protein